MHEVLQEPASAQQSFSSARNPAVWRTIPVLEFLKESWTNISNLPRFSIDMKSAIEEGLENLDKWYQKTDDTDVYFVCLALNPNFKTAYAKNKWADEYFEEGIAQLEALFDSYSAKAPAKSSNTSEGSSSHTNVQRQDDVSAKAPTDRNFRQYGHAWMRAAVQARREEDDTALNPRAELVAYLTAPLEDGVDDVVAWWGLHSSQYPTLARIARDYLAIQGSAVASERAFSSGALTATLRRNRLTPVMFEALQILKSAYRNGHISAEKDTLDRMAEFLDIAMAADKEGDF